MKSLKGNSLGLGFWGLVKALLSIELCLLAGSSKFYALTVGQELTRSIASICYGVGAMKRKS